MWTRPHRNQGERTIELKPAEVGDSGAATDVVGVAQLR